MCKIKSVGLLTPDIVIFICFSIIPAEPPYGSFPKEGDPTGGCPSAGRSLGGAPSHQGASAQLRIHQANITPIMENQMERNMENEMEAGII